MNSQSPDPATPGSEGASPWHRLKDKRVAFFTLPLLVVATLVEIVILATGWKYQKTVSLPPGMGVTFFGIGPIGATILAVECLKLPLAIWTSSRVGWQKAFMLCAGLPLICLLTFQLVKDMAVYEMGVALTPATEMLEKASAEEVKIAQLKGELAAIEEKKADRERALAELDAKHAKTKADLEEALAHNEATREEAITLTDYQKTELSEVEARQAAIIKQADADAAQINKALADLRARREVEVGRASEWNAEEARIENAYKAEMAEYANKKAAYDKDKTAYENASFFKRQVLKKPVDPGVPPVRETNTILKPTAIAELDAQIQAKEAELAEVNTRRRERVAQVATDARLLREQYEGRSSARREEVDRKREELLAALAAAAKEWQTERARIDQEMAAAVQKVDGIRAQIDAAREKAEGFYEAREDAIKKTQVHRIATTVEIVRGLLFGKRPVSVTSTAKERGDLYTDQISMVRIWVYPVLAFAVAFLPTLMVEVGCTSLFKPESQRPRHRLGFLGRRLHALYIRAGRQKILRAERLAKGASAQIAARDEALAGKEAELQAAREERDAVSARHEEQLKKKEAQLQEALEKKEDEWNAKLADMADSLNRTILEKDALRDLQKSEVERQIQMRQNAWSDRLTQMRQELDDQRAAFEAERTALMQEHQEKLTAVSEEAKAQVVQARRQMADAELAAMEKSARQSHDLKEALSARDAAEAQLKHQADSLSRQLAQVQEDAARELEKAARQERLRLEQQQAEFDKTLRQREEDFERRMKQREQELSLEFDARLDGEKAKIEKNARRHEEELERQLESRASEVDARWKEEAQRQEEAAQIRLKQREQQLQAQAELRLSDALAQVEEDFSRREDELKRQYETRSREADARFRQELQQKELAFHAKLKQREQEWINKADARETELQDQWAADLNAREQEWEREFESRVSAAEARLAHDAQQKEEMFHKKLAQREKELQAQFDARQAELREQRDQDLRRREEEWERNAEANARAAEARWIDEIQRKEEEFQSKSRQRDQQWQAKLDALRVELQDQAEQDIRRREAELAETRGRALREQEVKLRDEMREKVEAAQAEAANREREVVAQVKALTENHRLAQMEWETELEKARGAIDPIKIQFARVEKERDEARLSASEGARQVKDLKEKLLELTSLLNGWKNGNEPMEDRIGRNGF